MVGFCALMIDLSEDDIEFIDTLKLRSGDGCFSIDNVISSWYEANSFTHHVFNIGPRKPDHEVPKLIILNKIFDFGNEKYGVKHILKNIPQNDNKFKTHYALVNGDHWRVPGSPWRRNKEYIHDNIDFKSTEQFDSIEHFITEHIERFI